MTETDRDTGLPILAPTPEEKPQEDLYEVVMGPKENAEIKEAEEEAKKLDDTLGQVGKVIIMNFAAAFEILHQVNQNQERRHKAHTRAVKASGVHADQVRGFRVDRGTIIIAKRKKEN